MKTCIIKQAAGIGDILFCQGIAKHYANSNHRVIYPLQSNLIYLQNYLVHPNIEFCNVEDDFEYKEYYNKGISIDTEEFVFLNLDTSYMYIPYGYANDGILPSKYQMVHLDPNSWINSLSIIRNSERERWLYYDYLKLTDEEPYILVNTKHGTPPNYAEFPIPSIDSENRLVSMDFIEGTTIMDWLLVMEKASGIVTVDTCIQYLLEKLNHNYEFYYCYTRDGTKNHIHRFGLDKIFTIKWNYIYN